MTRETEWRAEWELLRAERERARRRWRSAADALAARSHDPLGLRNLVHDHPIAAGGIGAAVAALLVKSFFGRKRAPHADTAQDDERKRAPSAWSNVLRDAAVSIAVPWLVRMLREHFGWDLDRNAAPEPDRPQAAVADSETPTPQA